MRSPRRSAQPLLSDPTGMMVDVKAGRTDSPLAAPVVLLDDPATWPDATTIAVNDAAERLHGSTEYPVDLRPTESEEEAIETGLIGHRIRVHHCTRLLPFERESILRDGLAPTSTGLLQARLDGAVMAGLLTPQEVSGMSALNMLRPSARQRSNREGRLCAVTVRDAFDDPYGLWRLLGIWGGEFIYFDQPRHLQERLRSLGQPSLVVVDLPIDVRPRLGWYPSLSKVLVGVALALKHRGGETNQKTDTPWPATAIWQPEDPDYQAFPALPRQ